MWRLVFHWLVAKPLMAVVIGLDVRNRERRFKKGIFHLARRRPSVPIVPAYLHGCGRVLPKGAVLPVPLRCTAFVGTPVTGPAEDATRFVDELEATMTQLVDGTPFPEWR